MPTWYNIFKISAGGRKMTMGREGSIAGLRGYCDKHYIKHTTRNGKVFWEDKKGNRYVISSYRPIFIPAPIGK